MRKDYFVVGLALWSGQALLQSEISEAPECSSVHVSIVLVNIIYTGVRPNFTEIFCFLKS